VKNDRRSFLIAAGALCASPLLPAYARAADLELQQQGTLRIAVYADFAPYSKRGKGIDVAVGQALAEKLGLRAEIVEFPAGENMNDDLRNMVWKGHYLGTRPGDVMLHVPVDAYFAGQNDKVAIFAPYHMESMAIARNPERVPPVAGMPSEALEVFTREKVGVELDTHSDDYLMHALNGRLRDNVVHFRSIAEAMSAMKRGEVGAVMGPRAELEANLTDDKQFRLDDLKLTGMRASNWTLGLAVKEGSRELKAALSQGLAELQRSGELGRIFAAHGITHRVP